MYISTIFTYLMWPVIIIFTYWMVRWALRRFEKFESEEQEQSS